MTDQQAAMIAAAIKDGCGLIAAAISESGPDRLNDAIVSLENVAQSMAPMPAP